MDIGSSFEVPWSLIALRHWKLSRALKMGKLTREKLGQGSVVAAWAVAEPSAAALDKLTALRRSHPGWVDTRTHFGRPSSCRRGFAGSSAAGAGRAGDAAAAGGVAWAADIAVQRYRSC